MNTDIKKKLHTRCLEILSECRNNGGFLTQDQTDVLALASRTAATRVLVRCGGNRFLCTVSELRSKLFEVSASADYVRDVCIPADDFDNLPTKIKALELLWA